MESRAQKLELTKRVGTGLGEMAFLGLVVHAGKRGAYSLWMRSDDWVSGLGSPPDRPKCRAELLRKYIGQHGPVSKDDIMYWAYLSKDQLEQTLSNLQDELVKVKMKDVKEPTSPWTRARLRIIHLNPK